MRTSFRSIRIDGLPVARHQLAENVAIKPIEHDGAVHDRTFGGEIGDALATEVLFGQLSRGGAVQVGLKGERLTFRYR